MAPSINDCCNWLGTIDAKANELLDLAASSGGSDVANVAALKACVTQSIVFVAQLLRGLEPHDSEPHEVDPKPIVIRSMDTGYAVAAWYFDDPIRRN